MIFTERKVTVINDNATIDRPLIIYRGDKNIELKITIAESQFKFRNNDASNVIESTDASYAQLVITTPYGSPIFSDVAATKNGAVIFVITEGMVDEIREIGTYSFQIRLLDDNKQSRVTIPPVNNAIEIKAPLAVEDGSAIDSNTVNTAMAGYAATTYSTPLEAFDSQGNYIKTTWGEGDRITDAALNKIEAGIEGVNNKISSIDGSGVSIQDTANNFTSTNVEGALAELFQSVSSGKSLIASAITDKGVSTSNTATFQEMATNIGSISSTEGDNTQYSVTYNLSNVVSSNTAISINAGDSYTTTLTANSGYQLNTPTITVDGLDVTSKYYSNRVFTINNVFGNIIITADATEVISSGGLTLNYTFNNETAGNGYGTISLLADSDDTAGDYIIQYADDNGVLTNYDNICTLTATNGVQADYTHFIKEQMIPKYATKLIAVKDNETKAEFVIPEAKRFTSGSYGKHLYSFGAISDLHVGVSTWDTDFQEALTYFNDKESALFTCIAGDIADSGLEEQFQNYKNLKDTYSPDTPVYATNGNHEWNSSSFNDTLWNTYMENERTCIFKHGNDVFIMFGNEGTNPTNCFTNIQKTWLEAQLARYSGCRVFVFCHYFINGTDNGNFNSYYHGTTLSTSNDSGQWVLGLLQQYPNMFWFSGHSHMKFLVQELCSKINISDEYNGYLVHLSSITAPRDVINDSLTSKLTAQSEGVVIDVYENCILYRGRNFVDKKFLPIAQYIIPKTEGTLPDTIVYTVKTTMEGATSSNEAISVAENSSYTTTITAADGYIINGITVIMGVTDISSTAVNGNTITVDSVTDDLIIIVNTSKGEVVSTTWVSGSMDSNTGGDKGDTSAMRTDYIDFDNDSYEYYITVSSEFVGIEDIKIYQYNADGTYFSRKSYTASDLTPGVSAKIILPMATGKFRIKVDLNNSNTLENINDRLVISRVARSEKVVSTTVSLTWETGNIATGGVDDDSDTSAMRTDYIDFDNDSYEYYITVSSLFSGIASLKIYMYNADGSYNSRKSYTTSDLIQGIPSKIEFPITTGKFRIKADFGSSNTLENINDRILITKVVKETPSNVIDTTWETGNIASTGVDKTDTSAMRTDYIDCNTDSYTYYITVSSEFEGVENIKIYYYDTDGSFISRTAYGASDLTPEVPAEIPLPSTTGKFRIKADFMTTNTLGNIKDRLVITRVAK